ncbi:hypothetical protein [Pedobacter psychrodurus]|nr:hypothetical protein [Pedobacter psychrodurus]
MKTQKLAKRTLFVFKKKNSGKLGEPTTSEPTTTTFVTNTGII